MTEQEKPPLTAAVGKYVSIGDGTYANMNLTLIDDWKITIGKNVLIGPNVTLCTTGHPVRHVYRRVTEQFSQSRSVTMGCSSIAGG